MVSVYYTNDIRGKATMDTILVYYVGLGLMYNCVCVTNWVYVDVLFRSVCSEVFACTYVRTYYQVDHHIVVVVV